MAAFDSSAFSTSAFDEDAFDISATDVTAPTFSSASIPTAGTSITVNYSEPVSQGASYSDGDWTVTASGGAVTLTFSSGDGTSSHVLTTSRTIEAGETVTLDWAGTANGLEDGAGNDLAAFSGESVTNNSTADVTAPTLSSASISGDTLSLTFSETATRGAGYADGDWTVTASGGAVTLTYASGDGTTGWSLTTSRTVDPSETVTLDWAGTANGVEDDAGNDLASFSGESVVLSGDSRLVTIFVSGSVPSSASIRGGIAYSPTGGMYVAALSGAEVAYLAGRAVRADGALIISTGTAVSYKGGIGLTADGETVVSTSAPDLVHQGKPLTEDGKLCVTEVS